MQGLAWGVEVCMYGAASMSTNILGLFRVVAKRLDVAHREMLSTYCKIHWQNVVNKLSTELNTEINDMVKIINEM